MSTVTINRLTETVGAEVTGLNPDHFLNDDSLPDLVRQALEDNGVLVFPKLGLDRETQANFCARLGEVSFSQGKKTPEAGVMTVSLDPNKVAAAKTLKGAFNWHMDGCTLPNGQYPGAATILTAVALAEEGGETEFASTYAGYAALSPDEQQRLADVRVVHTVAATQRLVYPDATPEEQANWMVANSRTHPLVWTHRSGRKSMVLGATTESVVGMSDSAGRALLDDLLARTTAPGRVYRHEWSIGDMLMWDNRGVVHRVEPYADDSAREMIRTTLVGDEEIQ